MKLGVHHTRTRVDTVTYTHTHTHTHTHIHIHIHIHAYTHAHAHTHTHTHTHACTQLQSNLEALKCAEPLPDVVVEALDESWAKCRPDCPSYERGHSKI